MRFIFLPIFATMVSGQVCAQMSQMEAFGAGNAAGASSNLSALKDSINGAKGAEVIHGYSESPPTQSSYWSGAGSSLNTLMSGGASKITECGSTGLQATDPQYKQHCEAVDAIAKQPSRQPTNLITRDDSLLIQGNAITADPQAIAGAIDSNYSGCTTKTVTNDPPFAMQTCNDWAISSQDSCTVGQSVVVNPDYLYSCLQTLSIMQAGTCTIGDVVQVDVGYNYQCLKSPRRMTTQSCDRILVTTPVMTPGCRVGDFITRLAVPLPWGGSANWDFYCQEGFYRVHFFLGVMGTDLVIQDTAWFNIAASSGLTAPKTLGPLILPFAIGVFTTYAGLYYSQSCTDSSCSIENWYYSLFGEVVSNGSVTLLLPSRQIIVDSWEDQCLTLEGRAS